MSDLSDKTCVGNLITASDEPMCVVILSGGMDSTTALYKMVEKYGAKHVHAISFDYGQRHKKELKFAKLTTIKLGVKHIFIKMNNIFANSALTGDKEVPEGNYEDESMKDTVVPFRNTIMLSYAFAYAASSLIPKVVLGVHGGDHTIYPDCREEYIQAMRLIGLLGDYYKVEIVTPYQGYTKTLILAEGDDLKVDYNLTWSCYKGNEKACGKCGTCVERLEAFKFFGMEDPIEYEK